MSERHSEHFRRKLAKQKVSQIPADAAAMIAFDGDQSLPPDVRRRMVHSVETAKRELRENHLRGEGCLTEEEFLAREEARRRAATLTPLEKLLAGEVPAVDVVAPDYELVADERAGMTGADHVERKLERLEKRRTRKCRST